MAYCGYVKIINNIRKHPNADRLQIVNIFDLDVIVDNTYYIGQKVIYFPIDGQLDKEFAEKNSLIRKKDENGNNIGGYMDANKRNITAIKLRGEKSEGLILPIECLESYTDINELHDGDTISILNDVEICKKYIPRTNKKPKGNYIGKKKKENISPFFVKHEDTEQLAYNLNDFHCGDQIEITIKIHGTSQRSAYLPVLTEYKKTLLDRILHRQGTPIYEYNYIHGTRKTILENFEGGFYGNNDFRKPSAEFFEGKLHKGETVYYEVVGWADNNTPIMPSANNKKIGDKKFVKQYGDTTTFTYNCGKGQTDFYVYRMTMTNDEGDVVEYSPYQVRLRCEQMGCKSVPVCEQLFIPQVDNAGEYIREIAEKYYDGEDPIDNSHIREGVVVRVMNRPKFTAYKHKNFNFKVLAGIAVDNLTDNQIEGMSEDILSEV